MSQELKFLSVSLRNFMSFGNSAIEIDLTTEGTILINGDNVDTGGANGVGKTTIINSICYALFNNPFDKISLQRLINNTNGQKDTLMEVRLLFTKGDKLYEIYRCRGSSTNIEISCDGIDITLDSVGENDKFIVDLIGISYELFTNVIVFAGGMEPFLQKSIGDQRRLIEELFNITILSEKAKKLKDKIKITEFDINIQDAIIKEMQNAIVRYNKQVSDAEGRILKWEQDNANDIKKIQSQLLSIEGINFDEAQLKHDTLQTLTQKSNDTIKELKTFEKDLAKLLSASAKATNELKHLGEAKCPYCLQQYENAEEKINEISKDHKSIVLDISQLECKQSQKIEEQSKISNEIAELKESITYANIKSLQEIRSNSTVLSEKLNELKNSTNPHIEAYEVLLTESIKAVNTNKLDELKSKLEHQQFLLKLLTDKNSFIRRKIINKTIPFLNDRLNYYTNELGLPHIVNFDGDMSCTVSEYGRELDFGNLSNGEKKRVNLSMSLAFRDVLHYQHSRVNLMFVDEIDGGSLDTIGIESIISMIKQKSRDDSLSIWVISHRPEMVGRFDNEITIRKENGFSSIVIN